MELTLARQEIVQVGSASSRNTMALLPVGKKKKVGADAADDEHFTH